MGPDSLLLPGSGLRPQDRERFVYCITIIIIEYDRNAMAALWGSDPGNNRTVTHVSRGRRRIALVRPSGSGEGRGPASILGYGRPERERAAARRAADGADPADPAQAGAADGNSPGGADRGQHRGGLLCRLSRHGCAGGRCAGIPDLHADDDDVEWRV